MTRLDESKQLLASKCMRAAQSINVPGVESGRAPHRKRERADGNGRCITCHLAKATMQLSYCCAIMAAVGDNIIVSFTYSGEEDIPEDVSHVTVINVRVVRARAFLEHRKIVEVICHEDVEKIERGAFMCCPSLRRAIMPGVLIVEGGAFLNCIALTDVERENLEIIKEGAFVGCKSLKGVAFPSPLVNR